MVEFVDDSKFPFIVGFAVELLFDDDFGPRTSAIAFIAPTRGNVTCSNTGKLFFCANL